ncbi:FAD:protein FMN transferase [Rubrivivax sp. A210]|uniref:FAD:protein FMN transferase n=1 Tax=Rubrivivax sp. A210 TaxID=2772301 RepID=UPI001918ACF3|nr:FAD:protein FMN transferase [Rubrivivax sp. A210]CAD5372286.1 FAD:protein FMN transferase [Rubrivivax sp. A210]
MGRLLLQRREWLALAAGLWLLPPAQARHERRALFGSPADLLLPVAAPAAAADEVWRGLAAMNQRWNAWKPGEVSTVNAAFAAGRATRVSPSLRTLIEGAAAMERLSLGHFNAGIGGLVGQWGFHDDVMRPGQRPAAAEIAPWLATPPSLAQLEWQGLAVRSRNPRLQLDFGGYAKGVALDWALDRLQRAGMQDALLNLGGNLAAMGGTAGRPWRVGVRDPHGPGLVATLDTRGREAVVTSGSYERWRLLDGERCTHILDPRLGRPAPALVSVTVVHPSAALADAAATALLVAGPLIWRTLAREMGVDAVFVVDQAGRQSVTTALEARLNPPI